MERDWEVIRAILLELEKHLQVMPKMVADLGHDIESVKYHMDMLIQAGFVDGQSVRSKSLSGRARITSAYADRMTFAGHDLLDTIRSDTMWTKIKAVAIAKGIDLTFDAVKAIAGAVVSSWLGAGA